MCGQVLCVCGASCELTRWNRDERWSFMFGLTNLLQKLAQWFDKPLAMKTQRVAGRWNSRRPSTAVLDENIKKVPTLPLEQSHPLRALPEKLNISKGSIHTILIEKINRCQGFFRFIPHVLSDEQKQRYLFSLRRILLKLPTVMQKFSNFNYNKRWKLVLHVGPSN